MPRPRNSLFRYVTEQVWHGRAPVPVVHLLAENEHKLQPDHGNKGGKLNKAKKGELRFPLPVGFRYDEQGRIILDPDEEVRGAVAFVFRLFRETGSAFAVVQRFAERGFGADGLTSFAAVAMPLFVKHYRLGCAGLVRT